jgi:hypothetical protein
MKNTEKKVVKERTTKSDDTKRRQKDRIKRENGG